MLLWEEYKAIHPDGLLFVATLGASHYTYAEATWTQQLPDWIASHIRCFEFLESVPALLVPDYKARKLAETEELPFLYMTKQFLQYYPI